MTYSAGVFLIDQDSGNDTTRTTLTLCTASNPSGTIARINKTAHGLLTGAIVDLTAFSAWLNDAWRITVVDANNFDLDGAVWQATADTSGSVTPRGGWPKSDAWKTLTSGATAARIQPGDFVRIKKTSDPTSLGINGTWTNGPQQSTGTITSSTNATPIVITRASHGVSNGQTVIINGHTTNTNANGVWEAANVTANTFELKNADGTNSVGNGVGGATGTYRVVDSLRVMLASALTQNIACHGNQGASGAWTASANVTATVTTADNKEGGECCSLAIAAGFTTGLAAYKATGTLDLSGYQQLSFKIKQTAGTIGADGAVRLRLCSDAVGAVPVDTFDIPNLFALGNWVSFTVDKGSALGASIQSVAFYVVTDNGAQTFLLDNIIACKASSSADSLSLTSLIGKNSAGETFWPIASINGKRVMLDQTVNSRPTTGNAVLPRGYMGTTETVTAYKRETFKNRMTATQNPASNSIDFTLGDSGTEGNYIAVSGGWDTTNMTSQDGETWFDQQNGFGTAFSATGRSYFSFDKISAVRANQNLYTSACHDYSILNCHLNGATGAGWYSNQTSRVTLDIKAANCNGSYGLTTAPADTVTGTVGHVDGNFGIAGGALFGKDWDVTINKARNNALYGVQFELQSDNCVVRGLTTEGNVASGVSNTGGNQVLNKGGDNYLIGCTINESVEVTSSPYTNGRLWSVNHDGAANNDLCFVDGALVTRETSVRHVASGYAYTVDILTTIRTSFYPVEIELMRLAVAANTAVTIKWWMYRSASTITQSLVCKGGQLSGVAADVRSSVTVNATWEELTITFTPTEAGVVIITSETSGAVGQYGAFDEASSITQV